MPKKIYNFKAQVWLYPGLGGWHFVNVPGKISKEVREKYGKGMIKIMAKTGKSKWQTALFPYKNPNGEFGYIVSVKSLIRKKEGIYKGDNVSIFFELVK